jgi:tetratricopeptide (TPR) repeat protein
MIIGMLSSGCISNTSENQQVVKPTTLAPALEFHKSGFDAQIQGKYETALDYYNKSIAADPKNTRVWIDKGNTLMRLNRSNEALSAYDSALTLESNVPEIWTLRGKALMALERYTEALESFDKALQIAPESPEAKYNRNITLEKLK